MDTDSIIREIKNSMTGDPKKDGPFLKSQSEKYKDDENSAEINRELAKLLYQCSYDDMHKMCIRDSSKRAPRQGLYEDIEPCAGSIIMEVS